MAFEPVMPPYNISDPTATFLSSSCLDFLLIEIVPMAYRITNELEAAAQDSTSIRDGLSQAASQQNGATATTRKLLDEDEERDAVFYRLETLGYRVGQGLVERYASSTLYDYLLSLAKADADVTRVGEQILKRQTTLQRHLGRNKVRLQGPVDARLPQAGRQPEDESQGRLRADRQQLSAFLADERRGRGAGGLTGAAGMDTLLGRDNIWEVLVANEDSEQFLWFPCGIVRGALAAMGINATVQAETNELPGAVFQIKTISTKS